MICVTKADKVLIVLIIIVSLASFWFIKNEASLYNDKYISIEIDGKKYKEIIFDKSMIGKQIPIETEFGYNLVEIGDGEVWVVEASCPDELDVLQGKISEPGQMIVCLPNRMVIEIKGSEKINKKNKNEIDHFTR